MNIPALIAAALGISKTLWEFLKPLLIKESREALTALLPIALNIVRGVDETDKSNPKKKALALDRLAMEAKIEGIKAADRLLDTAVVIALNKLRAEQAAAEEKAKANTKAAAVVPIVLAFLMLAGCSKPITQESLWKEIDYAQNRIAYFHTEEGKSPKGSKERIAASNSINFWQGYHAALSGLSEKTTRKDIANIREYAAGELSDAKIRVERFPGDPAFVSSVQFWEGYVSALGIIAPNVK